MSLNTIFTSDLSVRHLSTTNETGKLNMLVMVELKFTEGFFD